MYKKNIHVFVMSSSPDWFEGFRPHVVFHFSSVNNKGVVSILKNSLCIVKSHATIDVGINAVDSPFLGLRLTGAFVGYELCTLWPIKEWRVAFRYFWWIWTARKGTWFELNLLVYLKCQSYWLWGEVDRRFVRLMEFITASVVMMIEGTINGQLIYCN